MVRPALFNDVSRCVGEEQNDSVESRVLERLRKSQRFMMCLNCVERMVLNKGGCGAHQTTVLSEKGIVEVWGENGSG